MKLAICGASGRMGIAIMNAALEKGHKITAAFDGPGSPFLGRDISELVRHEPSDVEIAEISSDALKKADLVIDFSSPRGTEALLEKAASLNKPVVTGTTGFSDDEKQIITDYSEKIPVLLSYNMSVGVNILFKLTELASRALRDFDVEIFEAHHKNKVDAPSGTAVKLLEIIKENSDKLKKADEKHGRKGIIGERTENEIGVHSLRGGGIVGEHTVFFAGDGERVELTHRAADRSIFARGAVLAAEFLSDKPAGLYSMFDVLGLNNG